MDNRIKAGASIACVCAITLTLLVIFPSPTAKMTLVMSAPSWDNYTRIDKIEIRNDEDSNIAIFTENDTTFDVDVGEVVDYVFVTVYLKKEYADNWQQAAEYTRVHMTIKNPADSTVFEGYLDDIGQAGDVGTAWWITKKEYTEHTLTEGTWTITTKYDAYV